MNRVIYGYPHRNLVRTLKTDLSGRKQSAPITRVGFMKVLTGKIVYHRA